MPMCRRTPALLLLFVFASCFLPSQCNAQLSVSGNLVPAELQLILLSVRDKLGSFLNSPQFPSQQVVRAFSFGVVDIDDPALLIQMQSILFTQMLSKPGTGLNIKSVRTAFADGRYVGLRKQGDELVLLQNASAICANSSIPSPCASIYSTTNQGFAASFKRYEHLNTTALPFYTNSVGKSGIWTDVYLLPTNELGLSYGVPFYNNPNELLGVVAVDMLVDDLDYNLFQALENSSATVFLVEQEVGEEEIEMVASNIPHISTRIVDGVPVQVEADDVDDELVASAGEFMSFADEEGIDYISRPVVTQEGFTIQASNYHASPGIGWKMVAIFPSVPTRDYIASNTALYEALCSFAAVVCFWTFALIGWVFRAREMQLWKAGQVPLLLLILVSNLICSCSVFVLLGEPSNETCLLRQWWVPLSVTFTNSVFLVKVLRTRVLMDTNGFFKRTFSSRSVVLLISFMIVCHAIILGIWTALDPLTKTTKYYTVNDVTYATLACTTKTSLGYILNGVYFAIIFLTGCVLSFQTRKMSSLFSESRALMLTFYHATFIALILTLIFSVGRLTVQETMTLIAGSLLWFTLTTQLLLFVPRIHHQLVEGDVTVEEAKKRLTQHLKGTESSAMHVTEQTPARNGSIQSQKPKRNAFMVDSRDPL